MRSPATLVRLLAAILGLLLATGATSATARAATRYIAPDGLDAANDCATAQAPCASFRAAYAAADPGDEVRVAAGRYPAQDILGPNHTSGDPVVFSAAPGAQVLLDGIAVERSGVTLRGFDLGRHDLTIRAQDLGSPPPVSDVTVEDVRGRNFDIFDATDVTIRGGEWAATAAPCGGPYGGYNNSIRELNGTQPARIVIEDTVIHDVQSLDLERCHTEGLAIFAGQDVTVRRTRFFGNGVYDVFAQPNSGAIDGLTFENNWFAPSVTANGEHPGATIGLSGITADVAIRNNSFGGPLVLDANARDPESLPRFENVRVTGNVGDLPAGGCAAGVDFAYNVWRGITCSATDVQLSPLPFASASTASDLDLHLTSGVAEDLVPPELAPADDIDGDARPAGAAADAGADERSGVTLPVVGGAPVLSPSGSDASPCTAAQPCLTMARALRAAHPGDTVRMAAGVYHDMSLPGDASGAPDARVTFAPATAGADVELDRGLAVRSQHVELRGLVFRAPLRIEETAQDVVVRDGTMPSFEILARGFREPDDITIQGGEVGSAEGDLSRIATTAPYATHSPTGVTLDGVHFAGSCLHVSAADTLAIRNSRFSGCAGDAVRIEWIDGSESMPAARITLENDMIAAGGDAIAVSGPQFWQGIHVRAISATAPIDLDPNGAYDDVEVVGNVLPSVSAPPGVRVDHNVFFAPGATAFGPDDQLAPAGFRDAAAGDLHLVAGAAAIDHGDPADAPATDIDGNIRPAGKAPDAGADEVPVAQPIPDPVGSGSPLSSGTGGTPPAGGSGAPPGSGTGRVAVPPALAVGLPPDGSALFVRRNAVRLRIGPLSVGGTVTLLLRTSRRYAVRKASPARALLAGTAKRTLLAGRGSTISVALDRPVRTLLARLGRVPVKVQLRFVADDGRRLSVVRSYVLRATG